ncbi:MAG: HEAT repeat domain-containing protein [Spirochaetales bacterium]|nr:HEAT repeat domain-containing protein [Spirochaetales bacterium]
METILYILFGCISCGIILAVSVARDRKNRLSDKKRNETEPSLSHQVSLNDFRAILLQFADHFTINRLNIGEKNDTFPFLKQSDIGPVSVAIDVGYEEGGHRCIVTLTPKTPYPLYIVRRKSFTPPEHMSLVRTGDRNFDSLFFVYSRYDFFARLLLDQPFRELLCGIGGDTSFFELSPSRLSVSVALDLLFSHKKLLVTLTDNLLRIDRIFSSCDVMEEKIIGNIFDSSDPGVKKEFLEKLSRIAGQQAASYHNSEDLLVKTILECSLSFRETCPEALLHSRELENVRKTTIETMLVKIISESDNVSLKKACIKELVSLSEKRGLMKYDREEVLRTCCHDESPLVRIMAAFYLGKKGLPLLYDHLLRTSLSIRKQALHAIVMIEGRSCVPALIQYYQKISINHEFKAAIIATLKDFGDRRASGFLVKELLNSNDPLLCNVIIEALAACGTKEAINALRRFSGQTDIERWLRRKALLAIKEIKETLKEKHDGWLSLSEKDDIKGALSDIETPETGTLSFTGEEKTD